MSEKFILSYADYAIFSLLLVGSASVGLYFLICGKKQKSNDDYLLAGKDMSVFPISFSLMATFMSATTLMGIPAEMYLFGTNMTFMNLGFILGPIIASTLFLPIYFKTGVSTSYEYLEKRFGKTTRRILCVIYLLQNVLFNGASLYAPALALSAVSNLSMWFSVVSIGVVCTFYCTLGGMKAVVWTDVFQSILMYICLTAIVIKGCLDLGGIQTIFKTAYDGERILLPTFKMDFSIRYTMWSVFLQGVIITTASYGAFQTQVQRQLTLKNLKRSLISSLLSIPMVVTFQLLCCLCGIIFYVYFQRCDPVTSPKHSITSYDQLMPYYIISTMTEYPGLPGLCIAGIFSATLSSISSSVNSMAAVTYQDIIRPIWTDLREEVLITKIARMILICYILFVCSFPYSVVNNQLKDYLLNSPNFVRNFRRYKIVIAFILFPAMRKIIGGVFYGALSIFVTFLVASMGNLIKATVLVVGMISGPALGVFLLASLTTTANEMGVNIGVVFGFLLAACVTFIPNNRYYPPLPLQNNCTEDAISTVNETLVKGDTQLLLNISDISEIDMPAHDLPDDFPISYMWITPLSLVVCLVTGYFASWIISYIRGESKHVPLELLSPLRQRFCTKNQDHIIQNNYPLKDLPVSFENTKKTNLLTKRFQNVLPLTDFDTK